MEPANRALYLNINKRLNADIADLARALEAGEIPPGLLDRVRRGTDAGLAGLRAMARGDSSNTEIPKVMEHLDLISTLAESVESAPDLSRKLLKHLLEEQVEITAAAGGTVAGAAARSGGAGDRTLPGGRRPLTVGSLIDR